MRIPGSRARVSASYFKTHERRHSQPVLAAALAALAGLAMQLNGCAKGSSCEGAGCAKPAAGATGQAGTQSGSFVMGAGAGASAPNAGDGAGREAAQSGTGAIGTAGTAVPAAGNGQGGDSGAALSGRGGSAGSSGAAGSSSGTAGSSPASLALPVVRGERCVLALGAITMEVSADQGGRITSLRHGQHELLTGPNVNAINHGSTFWTSPQADWGWPPIAAVDSAAFSVAQSAPEECLLQGMVVRDPAHPNVDGVRIEKRFSADVAAQALLVQYTIANQGTSARRLAPWAITRVAPGGLTFYASDSAPTGERKPATSSALGCVWLEHGASVPVDSKLFGDGEGWLAHVSPDGVLLLQVFDDVAPGAAASGEAEIELYTGAGYDEIEAQGSHTEIAPGAARSWTVRWLVRELPSSVARTAGNPELLAFVQALL